MSDKIEIKLSDVMCEQDMVDAYVNVLYGIEWFCNSPVHAGYRTGYRNEIAVNLVVASHMLGYDPMLMLEKFIEAGLIDPKNDDISTDYRFWVVTDYAPRFSWKWMIAPNWWKYRGIENRDDEDLPIRFVLQ